MYTNYTIASATNRFSPDLPELLDGFELDTLERDAHTIFALSTDLLLIYFNPAWLEFSRKNGGEPDISKNFGIGTPIISVISDPLKDFYTKIYRHALESGKVGNHEYECSSPDRYRLYHQSIYPFHNRKGLLIINSLAKEHEHVAESHLPAPPDPQRYRQQDGFITQCVHCRRVQRSAQPAIWDWIPDWVREMPPATTGGLCTTCYEYYFKLSPAA